jgi:hypothetical protein
MDASERTREPGRERVAHTLIQMSWSPRADAEKESDRTDILDFLSGDPRDP